MLDYLAVDISKDGKAWTKDGSVWSGLLDLIVNTQNNFAGALELEM
jgi:hypothetical protein